MNDTDENQAKLVQHARKLRSAAVGAGVGNRVGALIAQVFLWTIALIVTGTVLGIWIKLFWIGWVFAGR